MSKHSAARLHREIRAYLAFVDEIRAQRGDPLYVPGTVARIDEPLSSVVARIRAAMGYAS